LGLFNHAQVALPAFPSKGSGASRLWLMVAVLALLTPLGVLAVGKAWGEWSASDFENQQARAEIARTSRQVEPPPTPSGIRKLSGLWTAPFPDYAPAFIKNPIFGYVLSAMFGVGVLASASAAVDRILRRKPKGELES